MSRDTKEELERLEQALKEEEQMPQVPDTEEDAVSDEPQIYCNFANSYGQDLRNYATNYQAYNGDNLDVDLADFSEKVQEEGNRKTLWLPVVTAFLALAGLGYLVYLLAFVGGLI